MKYSRVLEGTFIRRENRFIAQVEVEGEAQRVFVPNTGRCRELFLPGRRVFLSKKDPESQRKTDYTLIHVDKDGLLVNIDAQAPNKLVGEVLEADVELEGFGRVRKVRPEVTVGKSRLDFAIEGEGGQGYLEVKGVTLEEDGLAAFPDAPTSRGARHLRELTALAREGTYAGVVFVLQMEGMRLFMPNEAMDPDFAQALREASRAGVHIFAWGVNFQGAHPKISYTVPHLLHGLSLERGREEDLPAIHKILQEGAEALMADGVDQWQRTAPGVRQIQLDLERQEQYVLRYQGEIVATGVLQQREEETYRDRRGKFRLPAPYTTIHRFAVAEKYKGQGFGREFLTLLIVESARLNFPSVRIDTHEHNEKMQRVIASCGFEAAGVIAVSDGDRLVFERSSSWK
ncbi:MAG: DNA/RNA nuclease SfsA [Tissierellia bacterium]|nr:DNA/RNA nuclease SfsA [Tissierellia bacterium]